MMLVALVVASESVPSWAARKSAAWTGAKRKTICCPSSTRGACQCECAILAAVFNPGRAYVDAQLLSHEVRSGRLGRIKESDGTERRREEAQAHEDADESGRAIEERRDIRCEEQYRFDGQGRARLEIRVAVGLS